MIEEVKKMIQPAVESLGFQLYALAYEQESNEWFLRVIIDSNEREITIDDCVSVTELINPILDKNDPINNEYMLEVASAGAEKELRNIEEYKRSIGKYIYIKLKSKVDKEDEYLATLKEVKDDSLEIQINLKGRMKMLNIEFNNIELIRLAVKF